MEENKKNSHKYDDILYLPHHVSKTHPQMSINDRAAQFSPFAALTGYEEKIKESARLTEQKTELDECGAAQLDEKLRRIDMAVGERPEVTVSFFKPDGRKAGGEYLEFTGKVKKIDVLTHQIIFCDGTVIDIKMVRDLRYY